MDKIAKQRLNVVILVDCSKSMQGERIAQVNSALRDIKTHLVDMQNENANVDFYITVITFSTDAYFLNGDRSKEIENFNFKDIKGGGWSNLHIAYQRLEEILKKESKGGIMPDFGGVAPILLLMTDGMPTSYDWQNHLDSLKKKGWFRVALKYALAIGIDTQEAMDVLSKFTGNPETVLKVYTAEALRKVIKVIAVTASKVKSNSSTMGVGAGAGATNNDVAREEIAEKLDDIKDIEW